ncbi:GNAT family N-acetyltransferase [Streptococcus pluranimalium]|uniref:GNAT family N-acetyltransferase n=1 Tax=Streptococcus pluranimalium TaxID=82348 RepID=UPI0024155C44|nr:GNAT family N-acetyltransferase [Streptococcus pluranimalium]MDY3041965.1 GNAT family N-acetyltransferase [Streptococcus pluranimalium]WFM79758.1 GNAT family N-acetyltransferase [Streptococcus pluranimalium]HEM6116688.1 GNAT family N-acetyltransferase [Streptococcus suis]
MIDYLKISPIFYPDILNFLKQNWDGKYMAVRGQLFDLSTLPGYIALHNGSIVGMVSYRQTTNALEIMSLDSILPNQGIGKKLCQFIEDEAKKLNLKAIHVITTNDNAQALAFYQKIGFKHYKTYLDAVALARVLKPSIPLEVNGIPIKDEIELRKELT